MVAKDLPYRERILALVEALPEEALPNVVSFLETERERLANRGQDKRPYIPTPMGGLWRGAKITEQDIAEARREMWGRFADDEP